MDKFEELDPKEQVKLYNDYNETLKTTFEETVDLLATKEELEQAVKADDLDAVKGIIDELEGKIEAIKENAKAPEVETTLAKEIELNLDAIKQIAAGVSNKEVVLKANTVRASVTNFDSAIELPDLGQLATRKLSMYDLFPKITLNPGTHNGTIRYYDWDEATTVRAAAMVAEGGTFPESTATWQSYTIDLKKVGDTLPVSAEFYEDAQLFAAELNMFLDLNVKLVIDNQICNGTGVGNNLTGLITSATAFSAVGLTTVPNAQFYDLLAVATEQITVTGGGKYIPNFVVMNKRSINQMRLTKDANENYIIPPFVGRDGKEVDGMVVVESNIVPDGELVLGDSRYAKIYEMGGITLAKGTVNAQFVEDMETIKARKRILFLIRNADAGGFIHISDIDAAIAAITAT